MTITAKSFARTALVALLATLALLTVAVAQESESAAFKIDALNPGLGAPPQALDRQTPQSSLEAFVAAVARGDHDVAAQMLDLAPLPEDQQQVCGPEYAAKLAEIIERKVPLDFGGIPDRPDGMDTTGSDRDPMVGEARKSILLGSLDLGAWPVGIRLNRVQVEGEDPVWVFSRQTVEHVPALYDRYGPTWFERELPHVLRTEAFWGLVWWELIAFPIMVSLAAAVGLIFYRLLTMIMDRVPTEGAREAVRRGRLPGALAVSGLFLQLLVLRVFVFSAGVDTTLALIFWALILIALVSGASRVLDTIIDFASDRYLDRIDKPENTNDRELYTNLSAAKRIGVIVVILVGLAAALSSLRVFSSFGLSLLFSAGVITAIFGLAAQTMLGNILASLQLALAKPMRIGDALYYNDHWAYVEKINYTFVQLRTWDQKRYIVPVKNFVSTAFENWTVAEPRMIMPVLLKLDHRTDVDLLRKKFEEIAANDPDWSEGAEPKVQVIGQNEDGMDVRFYCTADDPTAAWNLHCRVREEMLAFLRDRDGPSVLPRTRIAYADGEPGAHDIVAPTNDDAKSFDKGGADGASKGGNGRGKAGRGTAN